MDEKELQDLLLRLQQIEQRLDKLMFKKKIDESKLEYSKLPF